MMANIEDIKNLFRENVLKGRLLKWNDFEVLLEDYDIETIEVNKLKNWYQNVTSFSFFQDINLLEEVIIHNHKLMTYKGENYLESNETTLSQDDLELALITLAINNNIEWNFKNPFASFQTILNGKKFRVSLVHHSINPNGFSKAFFRSISKCIFKLESYVDDSIIKLLKDSISTKKNILVCGSTGSGKTSFLNSLIAQMSKDDHVVIIEDTYEIQSHLKYSTRMLSQKLENKSMTDYMAYAMRMSPDRIILGEIRSSEVVPYLLALNTGHKGGLATIHSNNAIDAIHRLALLYCIYSKSNLDYGLILKLVCKNIDKVIFLENKKVVEIIDVYGEENSNILHEVLYAPHAINMLDII